MIFLNLIAVTEYSGQLRVAAVPFMIAASSIVVVVGLYSFVTFGFSVMINIALTVFLQTPKEEVGYAFSPLQNAAWKDPSEFSHKF